jgi:hypothetical protein
MYAYLRIHTRDSERVSLPDGTEVHVAPGSGAEHAAQWRAERARVADDADLRQAEERKREREVEGARRAHEADLAEWQGRLDRALEFVSSITEMRAIRDEYAKGRPQPDPAYEEPKPVELADILDIPVPEVSTVRRWIALLVEIEPPTEFVLSADGAYPRAAVARALSELEGSGWSVIQVSEERAVIHQDGDSRALTIGAWILLHSES